MAYHQPQVSHHNIEADTTTSLLLPTTPSNDNKTLYNNINKAPTHTTGTCCHAHTRNVERNLVQPSYNYTQYHNATYWLLMFEEVARANNWSPRAKLDILPVYLQEGYLPRTWFRQNRYLWENVAGGEGTDAEEGRFEVFREAFLGEFGKEKKGWKEGTSRGGWALIALVFSLIVLLVILSVF